MLYTQGQLAEVVQLLARVCRHHPCSLFPVNPLLKEAMAPTETSGRWLSGRRKIRAHHRICNGKGGWEQCNEVATLWENLSIRTVRGTSVGWDHQRHEGQAFLPPLQCNLCQCNYNCLYVGGRKTAPACGRKKKITATNGTAKVRMCWNCVGDQLLISLCLTRWRKREWRTPNWQSRLPVGEG